LKKRTKKLLSVWGGALGGKVESFSASFCSQKEESLL
jgi:hypothetical protein